MTLTMLHASKQTQIWVVSHAPRLIATLAKDVSCNAINLEKELGQTLIPGQDLLTTPSWHWPES